MSTKIVLESSPDEYGKVETKTEDGGCALIGKTGLQTAELVIDGFPAKEVVPEGDGLGVDLISWHEDPSQIANPHSVLKRFAGKRIRVTIETID